jgi:hypothetical protein
MVFQKEKYFPRNINKNTKYKPSTKEIKYYAIDVTNHCEQHEVNGLLGILKRWFTCKYQPQSETEDDVMLVTSIR